MATKLLLAFLVLLLGIAAGVSTQWWLPIGRIQDTFVLGMALAVPGAAGGLLASLATSEGLKIPRWKSLPDQKLELGFLGDILFGIGGGMLLFVVVPGTVKHEQPEDWLKLYGLALVLGFAGRGVMNSAADQQLKQLKRRTDEVERSQTQQIADTDAAVLLAEFMEIKNADTPAVRQTLANALKKASAGAQQTLFRDAERVREAYWREAARLVRGAKDAVSKSKDLLERAGYVFLVLYDAGGAPANHRILASVGYVDYDLFRPEAAIPRLQAAIDAAQSQGDQKQPFYHFALAMAHLDAKLKAQQPIAHSDPTLAAIVDPLLNVAKNHEPFLKNLVEQIAAEAQEGAVTEYNRPLWRYLHQ